LPAPLLPPEPLEVLLPPELPPEAVVSPEPVFPEVVPAGLLVATAPAAEASALAVGLAELDVVPELDGEHPAIASPPARRQAQIPTPRRKRIHFLRRSNNAASLLNAV
jgi:hypothetical protein